MSVFLVFAKVILLKVAYPLKICQQTKFHGTTLTGATVSSTQTVQTTVPASQITPSHGILCHAGTRSMQGIKRRESGIWNRNWNEPGKK
jgi:hypothetical protein